ncbi:MAG: Crp/Fnr family transcriptional regulator [Acidobacteria bacterium]|nr:Crp/Fnr family transcriptional regulator [Acidobacteriota bacterium]
MKPESVPAFGAVIRLRARMTNDEWPRFPSHRDCRTLSKLTLEHLRGGGPVGRARSYRKGAHVWRAGDAADSIFFLRRGQVAVMMGDTEGHEVIVRVVGVVEPFGELCFCSAQGTTRRTTAKAIVQCEAVEIRLKDFLKHLREDEDALASLVFTFCVRLADAEHRIEVLAHRGAKERLGMLLLQLAAARAHAADGGEVVLPVGHEELAQMAAMSRPHVTVTMGKFRRLGLVSYGRNRQLKVDAEALKSFLAGDRSRVKGKERK